MDLALNNRKSLICHKPKQPTNQPTKSLKKRLGKLDIRPQHF